MAAYGWRGSARGVGGVMKASALLQQRQVRPLVAVYQESEGQFEPSQGIACTSQLPTKRRHLYSLELKRAVREEKLSVHFVNRHCYYLMTINHAATIGPCGPRPRPPGPAAGGGAPAGGAGAGPRSGWKRYALCVTGSTAIVFAPANVATVATTVYLSGESWRTTVTLPSPPFGM